MEKIEIVKRDTQKQNQGVSNDKLSKLDYIVKAAKLYGLGEVEINALKDHVSGKNVNEYIIITKKRKEDEYGIKIL